MATLPQLNSTKRSEEELAEELYLLIEGCFDEMELAQGERDTRYAALDRSLDARDVSRAKPSESL